MYFSEDELKVILSGSENTFFTLIIELIEVWYEHEKEIFRLFLWNTFKVRKNITRRDIFFMLMYVTQYGDKEKKNVLCSLVNNFMKKVDNLQGSTSTCFYSKLCPKYTTCINEIESLSYMKF